MSLSTFNLDPSFQGVNRLFVMGYNRAKLMGYNIIIYQELI